MCPLVASINCAVLRTRPAALRTEAPKFHQHAVAGGLDDTAVMLGDLQINELMS